MRGRGEFLEHDCAEAAAAICCHFLLVAAMSHAGTEAACIGCPFRSSFATGDATIPASLPFGKWDTGWRPSVDYSNPKRAARAMMAVGMALAMAACSHGDTGNNSGGSAGNASGANSGSTAADSAASNTDFGENDMDSNVAQYDTANSITVPATTNNGGGNNDHP